jgi:hypothetical protein
MTASKNKVYANAYNKYEDKAKDTKKRTKKKDTKVPEGYKKVEVKPAEMPTYKNPDDKSVKMPVYKNPEQYKSMERKRPKKYIIVPKDSSKIKEF